MRLILFLAIGAALIGAGAPAAAQRQPPLRNTCLHGSNENAIDAQRREEALLAVGLITQALARPLQRMPYPSWEALAESAGVARLRGMAGQTGDLARQMRWGAAEPLPGWTIHYVAGLGAYAFSLTDARDGCAFTYHANDTGLLVAGVATQPRPMMVPLETH